MGPNGIPGRVLEACASQLAATFTDISNLSMAQTIIPNFSNTHSDEVLRETGLSLY